jgi:hypothetical protein
MIRGRVQVEWICTDEVRAGTQRDWLNLQLTGRNYISESIPRARFKPSRGIWITVCDVAFSTLAEGDIVRTLCLSRMSADPLIAAGSWVQYHECPHEDGLNTCLSTLVRTVK